MTQPSSPHPWQISYDQGVDWNVTLEAYPVAHMLDQAAQNYPDAPALNFLGARQSWQQIHQQACDFAKALQHKGLGKGDRIGLCLPNSPFYLISYFAILKTGAAAVNLNPLYASQELSHLIEDADLKTIITLDLKMLFDKIEPMLAATCLEHIIICNFASALPPLKSCLFKWLKGKEIATIPKARRISHFAQLMEDASDLPWDEPNIDPHKDIALLQYTGGTTGLPKGAMLSHANIVMNAQQCRHWFQNIKEGEHKMLAVLPFFHVFAMTVIMNLSVLCALEIIAMPRFDLKDTLKAIAKNKPHLFPAVPAIYSAMNNAPSAKKYDLSSLLYCIAGGAPLPVQVKQDFETMTGCTLIEGYGLTESSPVVCANPMTGANVEGSIGLPLPGTIVEMIDPDAPEKGPLPIGERGELCIRGPQVMMGYWRNEEASADIIKDGRLHTGDIAMMDQRGYVKIVDRLKDMIITNGYNVYPRNVEDAIYQHPAIEECIVAGLPDQQRGELIKVWIKLKDGRSLDAQDLKSFLKERLSPMEIPRRYEFRDEPLPKTLIGKLSRKDVLAQEDA